MKEQAKKRGRPRKIVVEAEIPESIRVLITKACLNPCMVEARLDGAKVVVRVPRRLQKKLIGKYITVSSQPEDTGDSFIYEYLSNE